MPQQNPIGPRVSSQNNIYTLLLICAAVLLLAGIVFCAVQSVELFGSIWPAGGAG